MSEQLAPLSGDPDAIAGAAANYKTISQIILQASTELADISNNDKFASDAVVAIRSRASSTSARAKDVHDRYLDAANALATYATKLGSAQLKARSASSNYAVAEDQIQRLTIQSNHLHDQILQGGPESLALTKQKAAIDNEIQEYANQAATARANYLAAGVDKEKAAGDAIAGLQLAADAHNLNDTTEEAIRFNIANATKTVVDILNAVLETLASIMSKVSDILSIVGTILLFTPLAELGVILISASKVASLIALGATLGSFLLGGSTLGDLIKATIDAAASLLLGKLGKMASGAIEKDLSTVATKSMFKAVGKSDYKPFEELLTLTAGLFSDHYVDSAGDAGAFGPDSSLTLFPSSAGQPWNLPPAIPVDLGPVGGGADGSWTQTGAAPAAPGILVYATA